MKIGGKTKDMVKVCQEKRAYDTHAHAEDGADWTFWNYDRTVYPYRCAVCGKWHLTTEQPKP